MKISTKVFSAEVTYDAKWLNDMNCEKKKTHLAVMKIIPKIMMKIITKTEVSFGNSVSLY